MQAPYESPTVFNFFRPDFTPNGAIGDLNLFAPEFQINNDVSSLHLSNAYFTLINHGLSGGDLGNIGSKNNSADAILNFSYEVSISYNNQMLLNHLDLILCAGRLEPSVKQSIIDALIASNLSGMDKVKYATSLVVLSIEFNTLY